MHIYFARHGQTDWNVLGKLQGQTDIPLNDTGIQQAHQLADNLIQQDIHIVKVYTSRLTRAVQTAQIVADALNIDYEITPDLQEINFGLWEGHTWEELETLFPDSYHQFLSDQQRYIRADNGESIQDVAVRLFNTLDTLLKQNNEDILVITHGMVIRALIALTMNITTNEVYEKYPVHNAQAICFSKQQLLEAKARV